MELSPNQLSAVCELARAFYPRHTGLEALHSGEGIVMQITCGERDLILKVLTSSRDMTEAVRARLDWIDHLRRNGVRVPSLVHSTEGRRLAIVAIDQTFYIGYAYGKLPLTSGSKLDYDDPCTVRELGRVMASMHKLANQYRPAAGRSKIGQWDEADWIRSPEQVLHRSQAAVVDAIVQLRSIVSAFPRTAQNYGIIHDDLHSGNVHRLGDGLAVIDFDCCHTGWFAADIASALLFRAVCVRL